MFQILLVLTSITFHQACVRVMEGDTSAQVMNRIDRYIERKDPNLEATTYANFLQYYPEEYMLLLSYSTLTGSNKDMVDSLYGYCYNLSYAQFIWWGMTKRQRLLSFHEACVRYVVGDRSACVFQKIDRHIGNHKKKLGLAAFGILLDIYGEDFYTMEIDSIPDEVMTKTYDDAWSRVVYEEAYDNRPDELIMMPEPQDYEIVPVTEEEDKQ